MKKYRRLGAWTLRISPKSEYRFEELGEIILAPNVGTIYLHWYSIKGNLTATATLDEHMLVSTPVRVINNSEDITLVNVVEI
jgi:hypothetical protein